MIRTWDERERVISVQKRAWETTRAGVCHIGIIKCSKYSATLLPRRRNICIRERLFLIENLFPNIESGELSNRLNKLHIYHHHIEKEPAQLLPSSIRALHEVPWENTVTEPKARLHTKAKPKETMSIGGSAFNNTLRSEIRSADGGSGPGGFKGELVQDTAESNTGYTSLEARVEALIQQVDQLTRQVTRLSEHHRRKSMDGQSCKNHRLGIVHSRHIDTLLPDQRMRLVNDIRNTWNNLDRS